MRFEKAQQRRKQHGIGGAEPQLVSPNSGQVEEPLRPTLRAERCGQRSKGERDRIIWYPGCHGLERCVSG